MGMQWPLVHGYEIKENTFPCYPKFKENYSIANTIFKVGLT
jgi:hypothetical protein